MINFLRYCLLLIFLFTCSESKPLHVNDNITNIFLTPYVKYFRDHGKKYDIKSIQSIDDKFIESNKVLLSLGFDRDVALWSKAELQNDSKDELERFIEFAPSYVTDIRVYECTSSCIKLEPLEKDYFIDPVYKIDLNPHSISTFYIYAASDGTAVKTKLMLKDKKSTYTHARKLYSVYYLFFGAMIALFLYNLFLYLFSKEIVYIYYCLYLFSITFHQFLFVGLGPIILGQDFMDGFNKVSILAPSSFVLFMSVFVNSFFDMKNTHKKIYRFVLFYQITIIIGILFCIVDNRWLNLVMAVGTGGFFGILLLVYYLLVKSNILARFFVFGWSLVVFSVVMMELQNMGYYQLFVKFPYIIEFSVFLEAVLFSLALAYKIKLYKEEKEKAASLLIEQQQSEKQRLEEEVSQRTKELQESLDEREVLMKELNHRVKNNMQLIVSLLRLQANSANDQKLIDSLQVAEHRIQAMSHLHELPYAQDTLTHVDMQEYISHMTQELSKNFDPNLYVKVALHVKGKLPLKQAVYVGFILNEILINAYKYAFKDKGHIEITFTCEKEKALLHVKDDGVGFDQEKISHTALGMIVIKTLIQKQLNGVYNLITTGGTIWEVEFEL